MTTIAIVQARMTSTRFPGKVLADLLGEPMVIRQLERISRSAVIDRIVLATSSDPTDDVLAEIATQHGIDVVRGDLNDVLQRFMQVMDIYNPDVVVRLTADCPLASPQVINKVIEHFQSSDADYVSNTMSPTYPDGLDVEVVKAEVLRRVAQLSTDAAEREHVTLGVYRRPELFTIENVENEADLSDLRWTVDTKEDFEFIQKIYEDLYPKNPNFDMDSVLDYLLRNPESNRTTSDAKRNAALDGIDTGVMNA
jgi:spore coat polysaccharide biosynthesis protein SpsF